MFSYGNIILSHIKIILYDIDMDSSTFAQEEKSNYEIITLFFDLVSISRHFEISIPYSRIRAATAQFTKRKYYLK